MKTKIAVNQIAEAQNLLAIGSDWNRLCESTPNLVQGSGGAWDRSFPWILGWLSESFSGVDHKQRDMLVLTAKADSKLIGILPLLIQDGQDGFEMTLMGAEGCFGDLKGILASADNQRRVGIAFGDYLAKEWIGRIGRIHFDRALHEDEGLLSLIETLVTQLSWSAHRELSLAQRFVFRPALGPDREPIWPLATRRTIATVRKAYGSGVFEYVEADEGRDKQEIVKCAMAIRGMLKNDAPELKERFGSIPMAQRILDYRFAPGTAASLSKVGKLGVSNLYWKGSPIAGAMFVDYGGVRYVFWMEVRVHSAQERLVFWMLFSELMRSALKSGRTEIHLPSSMGARAAGMKDHAPAVCSLQAGPNVDKHNLELDPESALVQDTMGTAIGN